MKKKQRHERLLSMGDAILRVRWGPSAVSNGPWAFLFRLVGY